MLVSLTNKTIADNNYFTKLLLQLLLNHAFDLTQCAWIYIHEKLLGTSIFK